MPPISEESYAFDALLAGDFPRVTEKVTVITGQTLARGAVVGIITASSKATLSASAAGDGSETPVAVLAEAVDASAADVEAVVYRTGEFNEDAITLGTGHTVASVKDGLRQRSIFLKSPVSV